MTNNLKFHVTDNKLSRNDDIKYLSATNGIYDINVFYYGDYDADMASNAVQVATTLVACKGDGLRPDIKYIHGQIYVAITEGELLYLHRVEEYKQWLDEAKKSAAALAELLREYQFPAKI